eukprot:TRINITY_DN8967_c0_g2_i1.p1 TRINITY_DN8967_c0_g2~~TRINITY_DN8967_c0_g2_i1.p1  ORF type:complete len:261 (+),score=44.48 TRINITY_DN8967_c0_g2_i1:118-783(+)
MYVVGPPSLSPCPPSAPPISSVSSPLLVHPHHHDEGGILVPHPIQQHQLPHHPPPGYPQPGYPQQQQYYGAIGMPQPQAYAVYTDNYSRGHYHTHAIMCMAFHVIGLLAFAPFFIVSLALSLHLVRKGVIRHHQRASVIALSILELISWALIPATGWISVGTQTQYCIMWGQWSCAEYGYYTTYTWWGWISLLVMWFFALVFGLPRASITFQCRDNPAQVN